ncbi:hypothetical protein SDC9_151208 [bioreactor metagenome]|uniref:Uncharacterized protein n=1 Tax=bioreactor metagenome TaxID=1076179 RepID=A0A645ETY1_9ZZZZ
MAVGSAGMAQAPGSTSTQNSISFILTQAQQAGSVLELRDAAGATLVTFTPEKQFQNVVVSLPELQQGETYTLYYGGTELASVTASDVTTYYGSSGGQMQPGGGRQQGSGMQGGGASAR